MQVCKNKKGKLLINEDEVIEWHRKYFEDILNIIDLRKGAPEATEAVPTPVHKKSDYRLQRYRGIVLLRVAYKILSTCTRNRLKNEMEEITGE